jgi:hypothetical protein
MKRQRVNANVTRQYIESAPLPNHGDSYTVIPHSKVIEKVLTQLDNHGYTVERELYKCNLNAQIATGVYHIKSSLDNEMGMMFAWVNSYNKQKRFGCAAGSYVNVCMNGMIAGDLSVFSRKHTGNADLDANTVIGNQIGELDNQHKKLISDKNSMKKITVGAERQAELLGKMYIHENIITANQLGIVKKELESPSYNYNAGTDKLWTLYNHVTHAVKSSHPGNWMKDQQKVHEFFTQEFNAMMQPAPIDQPVVETIEEQPSAQLSILDLTFEL